jgi:hypothetical protein
MDWHGYTYITHKVRHRNLFRFNSNASSSFATAGGERQRAQSKSRPIKLPDRLKVGRKNTTPVTPRSRVNPPAGKRRKQKAGTEDALVDAASSAMSLDLRASPGSRHVEKSKRKALEPESVSDPSGRNEDSEEEDEHGEGGEDSADGGGDEEEGGDAGNDDDDDVQSGSSEDSDYADGSGSDSEGQSKAELAGARRLQAAEQPKKPKAVSQKADKEGEKVKKIQEAQPVKEPKQEKKNKPQQNPKVIIATVCDISQSGR